MHYRGLIILDRDGVLNKMVVHPEHGTVDSPLCADEVVLEEKVPEALQVLTAAGFLLCIATNQPAAAKGKTTRLHLDAVHQKVLDLAQAKGALIQASFICWHRREDDCSCRKPKTGLLKAALQTFPGFVPSNTWMVGDGVTDIEAGQRMGFKTAFLGPRTCSHCKVIETAKVVEGMAVYPTIWAGNLWQLAQSFLELEA